jgi:hypothetical protein
VYDDAILTAVRNEAPGEKPAPIELPEGYYKRAGEHARRRVVAAGVRLAEMLIGNPRQRASVGKR